MSGPQYEESYELYTFSDWPGMYFNFLKFTSCNTIGFTEFYLNHKAFCVCDSFSSKRSTSNLTNMIIILIILLSS